MTKIMLIHGWGYAYYTKNCDGKTDAWHNRRALADALESEYNVKYVTLPGFCGQPEPNRPWNLDDFTIFAKKEIESFEPDFILGYSFGGAVALNYKLKYNSAQKLILVSPALARRYKEPDTKHKIASSLIPKFAKDLMRDFYLSKIVKNSYYAQGTNFLKKSYLNIVDIDLSNDISRTNLDDICIIFGDKDTATPPSLFLEKSPVAKPITHIIKDGTHDIANTSTKQVLSIIENFVKSKSKSK